MSRCRACDTLLKFRELKKLKPDETHEDLCNLCKHIAYHPDSLDTREYVHGITTENPLAEILGSSFTSSED